MYPFFFDVDGYPEVRLTAGTAQQQARNTMALQHVIRSAHKRGIRLTLGIWDHIYRGGVQDTIPAFFITTDDAEFNLSIFGSIDLRLSLRSTPQGKPFRHAGLKTVSAIQSQENRPSGEPDKAPEQAG